MTTKCGCCGKDYNFDIQPSSYCTFHKKEYCWQCAKGCKDDTASCHYLFITDPSWMCKLQETCYGQT